MTVVVGGKDLLVRKHQRSCLSGGPVHVAFRESRTLSVVLGQCTAFGPNQALEVQRFEVSSNGTLVHNDLVFEPKLRPD